jgi:hypothetical protein
MVLSSESPRGGLAWLVLDLFLVAIDLDDAFYVLCPSFWAPLTLGMQKTVF